MSDWKTIKMLFIEDIQKDDILQFKNEQKDYNYLTKVIYKDKSKIKYNFVDRLDNRSVNEDSNKFEYTIKEKELYDIEYSWRWRKVPKNEMMAFL